MGVLRVAGSFVPAAAASGVETGLAGAAENVAAAAGTAADNAVDNGIIQAGEQAGAEGVVNAAPLATSAAGNPLTGIALSRQLGNEGERAVGIMGPKVGVEMPSGVMRFPDEAIGQPVNVLNEVKNVKSLSFTRQLRDYAAYAKAKGLTFNLYIRPSTQMSGPLKAAIASKELFVYGIPGAK